LPLSRDACAGWLPIAVTMPIRCGITSEPQAPPPPVIPGRRTRRQPVQYDLARYKDRWRIEAAFCRLKDFRRVATRYDKLAANFASAVALASIVAFWC
jgi:transposase